MAESVVKRNIVKIDLDSGNIRRSWINHSIGLSDNLGDAFGVELYRAGVPVNLGGATIMGYFHDPWGNNIVINGGDITYNLAVIYLPQACYNHEGQFTLALKIITDRETSSMVIFDGMIDNTNTGSAVAPTGTVPTYQEVLAVYDQMLEAKAGSVRFDIVQSLTDAQKLQAQNNMGAYYQPQIDTVNEKIGSTALPTTAQTLTGAIAEHEDDLTNQQGQITDLKSAMISNSVSYSTAIPSGADLNTYTTPGNYHVRTTAIAESLINGAVAASGKLIVFETAGTSNICQVYVSTFSTVMIRSKDNSGWKPWCSVGLPLDWRGSNEIPQNDNIDNYTKPNSYVVATTAIAATLTSWPSAYAGRLLVYTVNANSLVYQQVIDGEGREYTRRKSNTGWSDWKRTANVSEIPEKPVGTTVSYSTAIPSGADLNTYTTPGNYHVETTAIAESLINGAVGRSGKLIVFQTAGTSNICQVYIGTDLSAMIRSKDNTGWKSWCSIGLPLKYDGSLLIPQDANIDNYTTPNSYIVATTAIAETLTSWPSAYAGRLLVYTVNASSLVYQQVIDGEGQEYTRRKSNTGWSNWERTANSSNSPMLDQTGVTSIPANSDLDNYTTIGTYRVSTMAIAGTLLHYPSLFGSKIIVLTTNAASALCQICIANDGGIYCRVYSSGAWLKWIACNDQESFAENEQDTLGLMNNSHEIKTVLTYRASFANGVVPLKLRNYFGNIQNVHPKVLYFSDGFGDHKYWMAYTPYPYSNDTVENPCVAYSDDGFRWTNISANPLSDPQGYGYNSDTHLVYRSDTETLECWYRYVGDSSEEQREETIFRRTTTDGITWTAEEQVYTNTSGNYSRILSPAIIFEDGTYKIWCVQKKDDEPIKIVYYEAPGSDVASWTKIRDIDLSYTDQGITVAPWHLDAIKDGNSYVLLVMCRNGTSISNNHCSLFITTSTDNINYTNPYIIIQGSKIGWDRYMYRSSIVKIGSFYRIYYSAGTGGKTSIYNKAVWGIGIAESDTLNNFIGY